MTDGSWPRAIAAITLFVEDLDAAKEFYRRAFGLPVTFEDDDSAVFEFGDTLVNLLTTAAVPELIGPAPLAPSDAGSRFQLTVHVDDVDQLCDELSARGVRLLNGPMDRPWGVRTASFCAQQDIYGRSRGSEGRTSPARAPRSRKRIPSR